MSKPIMKIVQGNLFPPGTRVYCCHNPSRGAGTIIAGSMHDRAHVVWDERIRDIPNRFITEDDLILYMRLEFYRELFPEEQQLTVEEMLTHYAPLIRRRGQGILRKRIARERAKQLVSV